jgi:IS30 family transposase
MSLRTQRPKPGRALGGRPHRREAPGLGDRHPRRTPNPVHPVAAPTSPRRGSLHIAITAAFTGLPPTLVRSITWDQGIEMSRHTDITADLGAPVYFCDSHSPWQRGSNENSNGLLRQYFPKSTDLNRHTRAPASGRERSQRPRPRRVLGDRSPAQLFTTLLASPDHQTLRR